MQPCLRAEASDMIKLNVTYVHRRYGESTLAMPIGFYRNQETGENGVLWKDTSQIVAGIHYRAASLEWFIKEYDEQVPRGEHDRPAQQGDRG